MMFLIGRRRGCRRNPKVAAVLGMASALVLAGAAIAERTDGAGAPLFAGIAIGVTLVAIVLVRLVAISRDGDGA